MVEKNKTWTLRFPAKENPNMEKALFDWPIVLQYDVKAISRKFFGHEVFSAERSLNQPKATRVCIRSINQSNRSISVRLLFLFCLRVFISRSYENRSTNWGHPLFTSPVQLETGPPFYVVILAVCRAKAVTSFLSFFKTLSIGPSPGTEPTTSRSTVKRSTDWANALRG